MNARRGTKVPPPPGLGSKSTNLDKIIIFYINKRYNFGISSTSPPTVYISAGVLAN